MQLAHPLVAAGVAEHSSFRAAPMTAVARLHHTIRAMLALTFGDAQKRTAAIDGIREIHRRVHGQLREGVGVFPAGTAYSAEDPELLLWVHVTLLDSIPLIYEQLVMPLGSEERDAYCAEAASVAVELGARDASVPRTWADATRYLGRMYASGAIAVGPQARDVAAAVLAPGLRIASPLAALNRLVTAGLLPEELREQYGLPWNIQRGRAFRRTMTTLRTARHVTPRVLALWPEAI
jgi:uncharacterized protein (DUF2236 family)